MRRTLMLAVALAGGAFAAQATEVTFTFPLKSGPLLGEIATGTIDLEDGIFTGNGSEVFVLPGAQQNFRGSGQILSFSVSISTLTFTEANRIGSLTDFIVRFQDGTVDQLSYSGALFNPGASLFLTVTKSVSKGDVRTTSGTGTQLQSLGGPFEFTVIP